jgi:glycosyltransferase involved in cell wall biosynthesis
MRIALVAHGLPPHERTGVESYVAALARELARSGHRVAVFAPRRGPDAGRGLDAPHLALRNERRDGYDVTWLALGEPPHDARERCETPGAAAAFATFLEREQPEVVHFHHLAKLGFGLIDVAAARGIATLLTAHDFHAVCHRATLLRPDLEMCPTVGDPSLCARCDGALEMLDTQPELSDYQMGASPEQLDAAGRRGLAELLAREAPPATREVRRELDRARQLSLAKLDWILAPSRCVRERLIEGGIAAEKIELAPCGVDGRALGALEPPRGAPEIVRFGFLGGLSKHKGVHVLLDAWSQLDAPAHLEIHGDSTDRAYVAAMEARASELGVAWRGAFEQRDLPRVLGGLDVVVVPSIWLENAPFVIREAFAARRPVIASRTEALAESVRDGVDGQLFELGDARDLARVLRRCATERELIERWSRAIVAPMDIADDARRSVGRYDRLRAARRSKAPHELPQSLRLFAHRYVRLAGTPTRDLFDVVDAGIERLRAALAPEVESSQLRETALASSRARDEIADLRREVSWLREVLAGRDGQLAALRNDHSSLAAERDWLRATAADRERAVAALERERTWLRGTIDADAARIEAGNRALEQSQAALAGSVRELEWLRDLHSSVERELDWLRGVRADVERERDGLRATLEDARVARGELSQALEDAQRRSDDAQARKDELARRVDDLAREHASLEKHEQWLRGASKALAELVLAGDVAPTSDIDRVLGDARGRAVAMLDELRWRREQMHGARADGGAVIRGLIARSALGRRFEGWSERDRK